MIDSLLFNCTLETSISFGAICYIYVMCYICSLTIPTLGGINENLGINSALAPVCVGINVVDVNIISLL